MVHMYLLLATVMGVAVLLVWLFFSIRRSAQDRLREKSMKRVMKDVHHAKMARDRLVSDPEYRRRVRERFTRS